MARQPRVCVGGTWGTASPGGDLEQRPVGPWEEEDYVGKAAGTSVPWPLGPCVPSLVSPERRASSGLASARLGMRSGCGAEWAEVLVSPPERVTSFFRGHLSPMQGPSGTRGLWKGSEKTPSSTSPVGRSPPLRSPPLAHPWAG